MKKTVDESALITTPESRQIAGAALDVFEAFLIDLIHRKALGTLRQMIEDEHKHIAQRLAEDVLRFEDVLLPMHVNSS